MFGPAVVDVLVVDYHSPNDLRAFLQSVPAAAGDLPYRLWIGQPDVVATEDTDPFAVDVDPARAEVIMWPDNVGYNRALNYLGSLGEAPIIACFNADVILSPGSLEQLASAAANHAWGLIGPRQEWSGKITNGGIFGTQIEPRFRDWKAPAVRGRADDIREDAIYVQGSALVLRREVWDELTACPLYQEVATGAEGPWLPVQHFYGDSYLSLHAAAHGYKRVFLGTTTIQHRCGARPMGERDKPDRARFRGACDHHGIEHE